MRPLLHHSSTSNCKMIRRLSIQNHHLFRGNSPLSLHFRTKMQSNVGIHIAICNSHAVPGPPPVLDSRIGFSIVDRSFRPSELEFAASMAWPCRTSNLSEMTKMIPNEHEMMIYGRLLVCCCELQHKCHILFGAFH